MIISPLDFPRLTPDNRRITSPATPEYNCIAWSAGDTERWWQPGVYWPIATPPDDCGIGILERAFVALGFEDCVNDNWEPGYEKIAIYGSGWMYTHAARQQPNAKWTSNLGRSEDIEHDSSDDVAGGVYGEVVQFMKRPVITA